jgi:hypothetical protein
LFQKKKERKIKGGREGEREGRRESDREEGRRLTLFSQVFWHVNALPQKQ